MEKDKKVLIEILESRSEEERKIQLKRYFYSLEIVEDRYAINKRFYKMDISLLVFSSLVVIFCAVIGASFISILPLMPGVYLSSKSMYRNKKDIEEGKKTLSDLYEFLDIFKMYISEENIKIIKDECYKEMGLIKSNVIKGKKLGLKGW